MPARYRVPGSAGGHWRCGWRRASSPAGRRGGWVISVGADPGRNQSRPLVRLSWRASSVVAALGIGVSLGVAAQAPNYRLTYHLRVVERAAGETRLLASAAVSGPRETDLRLALRGRATELQSLLSTLPEPDTVSLGGVFFTRRLVGRSRRGLPLWEEDTYRRWSRIPWGETTLLYPFGPPAVGQRRVVWVEITVSRGFAAGETRASEEVTVMDSAVGFTAQAVIPPRRVMVRMTLVRGDTASSRRAVDLVPETTGRRVSFKLGRETFDFDVALERPEPPRTGRDSALAIDMDVVCLRVIAPESPETARVRCGRLDNIARRVALVGGDTLLATCAGHRRAEHGIIQGWSGSNGSTLRSSTSPSRRCGRATTPINTSSAHASCCSRTTSARA